ncbi:unnamed protein product [Lymnaea stagnalis]|uniref:PID domain-containing protein n=1 Tax=Lymnaea stagnalis TaxID=6523 RepID=A0AAV2IM28_LYMST
MAARGKKVLSPNDPARFAGNGLSYKAKLIGIENVPEARGDQMCQETITKLKNSVKISGQHKQKIFVQVTLEGLKIIDAISLSLNHTKKKGEPKSPKPGEVTERTEKEQDLIVLHTHAVHRISFISRDTTDNRAFGYIYGEEDGTHKFYAIKTASAAEQLVLALRDLFQVVYEMKKKEMDEAKENLETGEIAQNNNEGNLQPSGDGSTSGNGQVSEMYFSIWSNWSWLWSSNFSRQNIIVPTNNAPVNPPTQAEQVANLLDLEDQADHILKDIEQIKNLEFDSLTSDSLFSPTSPSPSLTSQLANLATPSSAGTASIVDPWGLSSNAAPSPVSPASSALGDLAGLQTGPFSSTPQTPFSSPFQMQTGFMGAPRFNVMGGGSLPVNRDPFGNDPFNTGAQQRVQPAPGFGAAPNMFGSGGMAPQFGAPPGGNMMTSGLMPGLVSHGFMSQPGVGGIRNPFAPQFAAPQFAAPQMTSLFAEEEPNLLKPMKKESGAEASGTTAADSALARSKSPRDDLFGDLVDIKKTTPVAALSPKDLFVQANAPERKSLNEMKSSPKPAVVASAQASDPVSPDPFQQTNFFATDFPPSSFETSEGSPSETLPDPPEMDPPGCPILSNDPLNLDAPPPVPERQLFNSYADPHTYTPQPLQANPSSSTQVNPPVPRRSNIKCKDTLLTGAPHPFPQLILSVSSTNYSCMLPSPDEPPPPLPPHLTSPVVAPTPPPRPSSSLSSSQQSPTHQKNSGENLPILISAGHHFNIADKAGYESSHVCDNTIESQNFPDEEKMESPDFYLNTETCNISHADPGKCTPPLNNNTLVCKGEPHGADPMFNASDPFHDNITSLNKSDIHFESDPFSESFVAKDEKDPFNLPFHLTPGFKAVAKFGSDPFDDSFSGFSSSKADHWDAFGASEHGANLESGGSSVPSPVFDAFSASLQPTNGTPLPAINPFGVSSALTDEPVSGNSLLD